MKTRNRFVVLCEARTGSYHLISKLDSCRDIVCHGELFKDKKVEVAHWFRKRLTVTDPSGRDSDAVGFIDSLQALTPRRHFGFKLFSQHLRRVPELHSLLFAPDWRRVILVRDPIEVYASSLRAHATGIWTNTSERPKDRSALDTQITFTPESYEKFINHYNAFTGLAHYLAAMRHSFVINYKDLSDPTALDALLRFVGSRSTAEEMSSDFKKQFSGTVSEGFTNWDEFQDYRAKQDRMLPLPVANYTKRRLVKQAKSAEAREHVASPETQDRA